MLVPAPTHFVVSVPHLICCSSTEEAFLLFDAENVGSIDYHELKVAIRALGFEVSKEEVTQLAREVDIEETGRIDLGQFVQILAPKIRDRDPDEEIAKAFRLFDYDNRGIISLKNMRHVARELGETLSDDELQAMIDEFDRDQDGAIDEREFLYIMKQTSHF